MARILLPITAGVPYQTMTIELDGSVYGFTLRYNSRAGAWAMDIRDADDALLAGGVMVRTGCNLLARYADAAFPPGILAAVNFANPYAEPDIDNLGGDCQLVYEGVA